MPSLRDSTLLSLPDPALPCRALIVPSPSTSLRAGSAGLVVVLPVKLVIEFSSSRAPYAVGTIAKSQLGQI